MKINKLITATLFSMFIVVSFVFSTIKTVHAQAPDAGCTFANLAECTEPQTRVETILCNTLTGCINQGLNLMFLIAVILSVIYLLLAGIGLIRAGDSGDALKKARTKVTHAVVGLIIVMLSWAITSLALRTILTDAEQAPKVEEILKTQ